MREDSLLSILSSAFSFCYSFKRLISVKMTGRNKFKTCLFIYLSISLPIFTQTYTHTHVQVSTWYSFTTLKHPDNFHFFCSLLFFKRLSSRWHLPFKLKSDFLTPPKTAKIYFFVVVFSTNISLYCLLLLL